MTEDKNNPAGRPEGDDAAFTDRGRDRSRDDGRRKADGRPGTRPGGRYNTKDRGISPERGAPRRDNPRDNPRDGKPDGRPKGAASALIELDRDLMKLLVRRATLVARMRGGRDHAATPAAIQAEKAVRVAWETGALAFSKDPRFTRQLFTLLQDIKVMNKEQARGAGSFNLTPAQSPVSGAVSGPVSVRAAQMRAALAASLGCPLQMDGVLSSSTLMDTVKALSQAGADISQQPTGAGLCSVSVRPGKALSFADKTLYAGEDSFSLHLLAFLALAKPGTCRFTGGSKLKSADLTPLRQALPLFGARLAHVIPRSQGLPANIECSGDIPPLVVVPPDLPFEGLCALLLAPLAWNTAVTLNLAALPAAVATAALAEVRPLHRDAGADVETHGPHLVFTPAPLNPPEHPDLPLDSALCAYLLALPAFAGGSLTLKGRWAPQRPDAREAAQLLAWSGVVLEEAADSVTARAGDAPFSLPLQCNDLSASLGPLFLTLAAKRLSLTGQAFSLTDLAPFPQDETETALAQDFFARLGLTFDDGRLGPAETAGLPADAEPGQAPSQAPSWTSPDAYWSMAYALAAYLRRGLQLANPGNISEVMPTFWSIYNSLPEPLDPAAARPAPEEPPVDKPARRRIIAD